MTGLYVHRRWLLMLGAAVLLLACGDPLLHLAHTALEQKTRHLESETQNLAQALGQLRADAASAKAMSKDLKAGEMEAYLAPVDRRQVAAGLEPLAKTARLESFTYTLSPEQPFKPGPATADADGLVESSLTLEADAPHDGDVYRFLDRLMPSLPGRVTLQQLAIERLGAGDARLAATNVRLHAVIDWLANESRKESK